MLIATSGWREGSAAVDTTVVLGASLRAHVVRRSGLTVDSRFLAAAAAKRGLATVYLVASGWLEPLGEARIAGRSAWILEETELDHVAEGSRTFRTGGDPFVGLQLAVPEAHVLLPRGLAEGPRALPAPVWSTVEALAGAGTVPEIEHACRRTATALVDAGVLAAHAAADLTLEEPPHMRRVWAVVAALYREQNTSAYVSALAEAAQLSVRQTERDLAELSRRFGVSNGFRATVKVLRLRRAVMLLSAKDATVAAVARTVGYGSVDAMGRAFRDVRLPSPAAVRAALLARP